LGRFEGGGRSSRVLYLKLHFEQFEDSRTFTNFIEPLLPKNRLNNPVLFMYQLGLIAKEMG
jgi:hypothetical protein